MDQLNNLANSSLYAIPFIILGVAIMGSLHCSMMCGGLVIASCNKRKDHIYYQLGRLGGYIILASTLHFLGQIIIFKNLKYFSNISSIFVGLFFILIGIKQLKTTNQHLPLPAFLSKISIIVHKKFLNFPLLIGFFSFLLPCGFLYSVMLSTITLNSLISSIIIALFFWLGTAPALIMAPLIVQKILMPLKKKTPIILSISFILLGFFTISLKFKHKHNKHIHKSKIKDSLNINKMRHLHHETKRAHKREK